MSLLWVIITPQLAIGSAYFLVAMDSPAPQLSEPCPDSPKLVLELCSSKEYCYVATKVSMMHTHPRCQYPREEADLSNAAPRGTLPLKLTELWPAKNLLCRC